MASERIMDMNYVHRPPINHQDYFPTTASVTHDNRSGRSPSLMKVSSMIIQDYTAPTQ